MTPSSHRKFCPSLGSTSGRGWKEKKDEKQQTFDFVGGVKGKLSEVGNHKSRVELQIMAPVLLLLLLVYGGNADFTLHPLIRPPCLEGEQKSSFFCMLSRAVDNYPS